VTETVQCSRAGCRLTAEWNVNWRNPRLHTADRVKVWLACPEHRDFLHDYLASRGFPVVVTPFGVDVERVPDAVGTNRPEGDAP
jgi:hypothetical protein